MFVEGDVDQLDEDDTVALAVDDITLFQYARICQRFPAYTLESLQNAPARDLLRALELLEIAAKIQQG